MGERCGGDHGPHDHRHGDGCGHRSVRHGDHDDFLHDGHLHAPHAGHVDDHRLDLSTGRPGVCAPLDCPERHGFGCGHAAVPHGDHVDFEVEGTLHHPHGDHCDLHGLL